MTHRDRRKMRVFWKTQQTDARAVVAVLVPVSMETQMCCPCSDASQEHWSCGRADMIHTCQWPADRTEHTPVSIHSNSVTPSRDTGRPCVGQEGQATKPGSDQEWHPLRESGMNSCCGLYHPLSDLCPDWHLAPHLSQSTTQIPFCLRSLHIGTHTSYLCSYK